jgi:hypothetical protein
MTWDGEAFRPATPFWAHKADQAFVIGQSYRLVEEKERSSRSHRFFFACVNAAWDNLNDHWKGLLPSPDHLRAYALCRAGHCDTQVFTLSSPDIAHTVAAAMRSLDQFAVVDVTKNVVTLHVAHSQSYRAMDKVTFRRSSDDVLRMISEMIGVSAEQLGQAAKAAA